MKYTGKNFNARLDFADGSYFQRRYQSITISGIEDTLIQDYQEEFDLWSRFEVNKSIVKITIREVRNKIN